MTELKQFKLPDVGEGLTEADIVKWHVQPGDRVTINQIIVEIETAKAVVELPSPFEGVVAGLLAAEGTTVDVGTPIISVRRWRGAGDARPGDAAAPSRYAAPRRTAERGLIAVAAPGGSPRPGRAPPRAGRRRGGGRRRPRRREERQAVLVGYGVSSAAPPAGRASRRRAAQRPPQPPAAAAAGPGSGRPRPRPQPRQRRAPAGRRDRALAKPPVRKLARDLGVDLAALTGTGPQGSITRDDVQQAAGGTRCRRRDGAGQAAAGWPR